MKFPPRPPQQCTLLVWRVGTTGHLFSTFTGKVDWVSTLIEISFNFHLMRVRQCSLQLLGSLVLSAVVGILGMVLVGTSRSFIVSFWLKMQQQQMFTHSPLLTVYTEFHCTKNWNKYISRSLHGGLSRDGREDEAYPLQPYYFLALIPWQYDHLDEEYAWYCDFSDMLETSHSSLLQ